MPMLRARSVHAGSSSLSTYSHVTHEQFSVAADDRHADVILQPIHSNPKPVSEEGPCLFPCFNFEEHQMQVVTKIKHQKGPATILL